MIAQLPLYLLLGGFVGVLAGLLGVGGGLVIVPVLFYLFSDAAFPTEIVMQLAVGTSLATIIPTSISSIVAHHRHGAILWPTFWRLTPGILIGSGLGALFAHKLSAEQLKHLFSLFEVVVALQMGLNLRPKPHRHLPAPLPLAGAGSIIGAISAMVGVGGGTLTVPYLLWHNIGIRRAVATSAATGLPIALAGAAGFLYHGLEETRTLPYSTGYIYWPALFGICAATIFTAPLGARLAHRLPTSQLKRIFALFLLIIAIKMVWG